MFKRFWPYRALPSHPGEKEEEEEVREEEVEQATSPKLAPHWQPRRRKGTQRGLHKEGPQGRAVSREGAGTPRDTVGNRGVPCRSTSSALLAPLQQNQYPMGTWGHRRASSE